MLKACHISATPNWKTGVANWGDKAIVFAVQKVFNSYFNNVKWENLNCRKIYKKDDIKFINQHDFVVVGGGGLILPDTFENKVSGWQWGISSELIESIKIPIIVYSIGWNLFNGQKPDQILKENLRTLVNKALFVSLRHSEDVKIFNNFVGMEKAVLNFCPTIIMDEYHKKDNKIVGFNIAGDRIEKRYKDPIKVFEKLLKVIKHLKHAGYEPIIINHMSVDKIFGRFIKKNINIPMINMDNLTVQEGIELYHQVEYMYATRGHAQMIPYGMGTKVISLLSHKKIGRFLNDVDAVETGIDINDTELIDKCISMLTKVNDIDSFKSRKLIEKNIKNNFELFIKYIETNNSNKNKVKIEKANYQHKNITLSLSQLQKNMKLQIEKKIQNGEYNFEYNLCPICKSEKFEQLADRDRYGLLMSVVICKQCGLIQTNPRMTETSYMRFYNAEYRKLYLGEQSVNKKYFTNQYLRGEKIFNELKTNGIIEKLPQNALVIDVGCSAGGIVKYFDDKGFMGKGIDIGEEYLNYGKNEYNLDLSVSRLRDFQFVKKANLIIYTDVFEHILDIREELQHIYSALDSNGYLYLHVPGIKNIHKEYNSELALYLQNAHTYHFSFETLNNIVKSYNFVAVNKNEKVTCIFKKNDNKLSPNKIINDYLPAMQYFKNLKKEKQLIEDEKSYKIKYIDRLHNIHKNEDIYVIAAGKSLDFYPLTFFNNKITIGINQVYKKLNCKYLIRKESKFIEESVATGSKIIISEYDSGDLNNIKNIKKRYENIYVFKHTQNQFTKINFRCLGIKDYLIVSFSTITSGIHLAAHMGAKNIIIVGHDCGLINNESFFTGYYNDINDTPWENWHQYQNWLKVIEKQTIETRCAIKKFYGSNIVSLNPFVNFGLEGNVYKK